MELETPSISGIVHYVPPKGLRVIRPRHSLMLQDYMRGMGRQALAMKYAVTPQTVTNLINDKSIQGLISAGVESSLSDLDALLPKAIDVVGEVMEFGSRKEKLAAADKVFRAKNLYRETDRGTISAEDVMQRLMVQFQGPTFNGPTIVQVGTPPPEPGP